MGRRLGGEGSVIFRATFCWETLGPGNIVADQVHHFMRTIFPNDRGLSQQENMLHHTSYIVQEGSEEHV